MKDRIKCDTSVSLSSLAMVAKEILQTENPVPTPACLVSGGETTVTIHGKGKGGRNQEFCLAAAIDIAGLNSIVVHSGGTDGNDGPTDVAGALCDGKTVARAMEKGYESIALFSREQFLSLF